MNRKGFTLVEIMIVVAIIALLAAIAIPSFLKSRQESRKSVCINNLRLIMHAKEQYGTSHNGLATDVVIANTDVEAYIKAIPTCPSGGAYTYGALNAAPVCSLAASPDLHVLP